MALLLALPLAATALLGAAVAVPRPLPAFVLGAWLIAVAEVVALPLLLSPVRAVDRAGYLLVELLFLGVAAAVWLAAGRPRPARPAVPRVADHPILLVLAAAVGLSLVYELVLCITVWPNNWDSLTYHLSRAASWYQHRRIGWIHDAPTERQNAFPANSELALLWSFVAVHSARIAALWQFFAQLAALAATYGIAVRLGFRRSSSVFASLLVATFALVALQSTTTQNDLLLASLLAACAYFVLGATPREGVLAGLAVALAVGTKLTALLALPALVLLAVVARPSRRTIVATLASAVTAFAALGAWLYVQNVEETGRLLGYGGGRVEHSPSLTVVGWIASVVRVLYRFFDFSGFNGAGPGLAVAVIVIAAASLGAGLLAYVDRRRRLSARGVAAAVAFPAAWPLVVLGGAALAEAVLRGVHFPIDPAGTSESPFGWRPSTRAQEDFSYFGPLGLILLVVVAGSLTVGSWRRRRPRAALAAAFPIFLAGLAAAYRFNEFVGRFMLVPVVLVAALLAVVYERRLLAAAVAALAVAMLVLVQLNNELKPMNKAPWSLSLAQTLDLQTWQLGIGEGFDALARAVPADACVGAAMGVDDASYPLFGPHVRRRVTYVPLPSSGGLGRPADDAVVIGPGESSLDPGAGWRLSSLGGYLRLAVRVGAARPFACDGPSAERSVR